MFIKGSAGYAFQLNSALSLTVTTPYAGAWAVTVKLSDGSTTSTGVLYETEAAAQEALAFLIDAAGWINPPGGAA